MFVREYHAERKRLAGASGRRRSEIERRCGEIDRALARATDALLYGVGDATAIDVRCKELRGERDALERELAALPNTDPVISLHPAALDRYAEQLKRLEHAIDEMVIGGAREAVDALRELVGEVTVKPGARYAAVEV